MKSEIHLFCQPFYPDSISTSQLFTDLFTRLAARGIASTVYCGYPARDAADLPRCEEHQGVRIRRLGFKIALKTSMASRLASYVSYLGAAFAAMMRLTPDDRVLGVTNPPFLLNLLWLASLIKGFSFTFMLHDVYPEGLDRVGILPEKRLLARLWSQFNAKAYRRATTLVVLGRDMAALLERRYKIAPDKIEYLPHWSPKAAHQPMAFADNPMARELALTDKFVIQYSGNMGLWHDMDGLVEAAALLRERDDIRFLFIGDGRRRAAAQALAARLKLANVTWLDYQPRERLDVSLTCCHAALISLRPGCEGVAVPCKLYGIMASGRAILAQVPGDSEVAMAVSESGCGLVAPPGDPEALARAVVAMAADRVQTAAMGERALAEYGEKYTLGAAVDHFARLLG